jgi:hypothetical protein
MSFIGFIGGIIVLLAIIMAIVHLVMDVIPERMERWRAKRLERRRLPQARAVRVPEPECTECSGRPSAGGYLCATHRRSPARPFMRTAAMGDLRPPPIAAGIREVTRTAAQLELLRSLHERGIISRARLDAEIERIAPDPRDRRPEPTGIPGPGVPRSG